MLGTTFVDVYGDEQYNHCLDTTRASLETTGAKQAIYDNYWGYHCLDSPVIAAFPNRVVVHKDPGSDYGVTVPGLP
jgi:hypothetical protein